MRKKLLNIFLFMTMILSCFSLFACEKKDNEIIHTYYTVGTFSGYRVDFVRIEYVGASVSEVVTEYYVDDVYIKTFANPSYKYLVYTSETDYVYLKKAYKQGLITHDDLLAIAEAEKPRDNLKEENEKQTQQSLAIA